MTRNKDLKRLVRTRMQKTGESYTAARARIVSKRSAAKTDSAANYAAPRAKWPALAGMSDDKVKASTGRTWAQWVAVLDEAGAHAWSHREIARHVGGTRPNVSAWWAQTVTVGYERIRGLRDVGQRRGGAYDANKSRTFAVGVSTLYRMFRDARKRAAWLPEGVTRVRTSIPDKSIRADWHDGTQVNFYFVPKSDAKCAVAIQHGKLAGRADVEKMKTFWARRLDDLKAALESG